MDGKTLYYSLRQLLEEDASSGFIDDLTSYQFLNEAAVDLQQRTKYLKGEDPITTIASTASYDLAADHMGLYLKNRSKKYFLKYNDGTVNSYITWISYESILLGDNSGNEAAVPGRFSIKDKPSLASQVTGTTSAVGAATGGKSALTDTGADFSDVEAGDWVHNTTDDSHGIIISKTSTTVLQTALFNGTDNDWSSSDAYVIQPQGRMQIVFDPPCSTGSHTATVYYLQRPAPVYSDYDVFRFPREFTPALVKYAAWLYKYRDREPNYGDKWYLYYDQQSRKMADQTNLMLRRKNFTVNLKAR